MTADTFRLVVSHGTAAVVVLGTVAGLFWLMGTGQVSVDVGVPALVGIAGGAVAFLFVQETAKQAEKAQARATMDVAAAAERVRAAGNGHATVTAGGPTTVVADEVTTE